MNTHIDLTDKQITAFWNKVNIAGAQECWTTNVNPNRNGYIDYSWSVEGKVRWSKMHRISAHLSGMDLKTGLCVCLSCDNPGCVNPAHLWLGTAAENTADKVSKGRQSRTSHALNMDIAREIRQGKKEWKGLVKDYYALMQTKYNIHWDTVANVIKGRTWKENK